MGSNPMPSAYGSMVKWTSCLASNEMFQVRVLVGLLEKNVMVSVVYAVGTVAAATGKGSTPFGHTSKPTWPDIERRPPCKRNHAGANPVVGPTSRWCNGSDGTLLKSKPWFDSRSGYLRNDTEELGGGSWLPTASTTNSFFETMSKRRRGYPSETYVKRGTRIVHGDKLLEEKLGRNDLCPCGSGNRFKKCCLKSGHF